MEEETKEGVIWNFDNAMGQLIFQMKVNFILKHKSGDLEGAYWELFYLLSELEPSLEDTPKKEVNSKFDEISEIRVKSENFKEIEEQDRDGVYGLMITLYRKLCNEMVENNFYFRKKKGYVGL